MTAKFQELVAKLKEIFQLDKPELDFGIYRIMHMRAKEIGEFLEKRLAEKVRTALAGNSAAEKSALEKELDEAIKSTKALGFDPEQSPKVQELRAKLAALGGDDEAEAKAKNPDDLELLWTKGRFIYNGGKGSASLARVPFERVVELARERCGGDESKLSEHDALVLWMSREYLDNMRLR